MSSKKVTLNFPEDKEQNDIKAPLISKPSKETGKEGNTIGIAIMLFITFLASVCFSIVLPSINLFLVNLVNNNIALANSITGWAVAINSIGSFIASPVFGAWADRRTTREVLAITLISMIFGNILYSLSTKYWLLLIARFIVGAASANYAVAQTYISYATTQSNRTFVMALNSAANVLGFIIGPSFALGLSYINFSIAGVQVDQYTSPGYLSAILSLVGLLSLVSLKEINKKKSSPTVLPKNGSLRYTGSGTYTASGGGSGFHPSSGSAKDLASLTQIKASNVPILPVVICLWAYFTYTTSFTTFETIGTPYTHENFGWDVEDNSIMFTVLGGVCIISLFLLQIFVRCFNDRILILICTVLSLVGFGFLITPSKKLELWRFCIGVICCSGGYATAVAVLISIYSKVLEGFDQGMLMGWLSSAGSIARIVGPLIASYVYSYGNNLILFIIIEALISTTFISYLLFYKRLAPTLETLIN